MKNHISGLLIAVSAVVTILPRPAAALPPVERHNWAAGVAYGVGRADVDFVDDAITVDGSRGGSPQFRIGKMIGNHLMIGVANRQWMDEGGLNDIKIRANTQSALLMLTAYPGSTTSWTSGFYLQAGYGFANARISELERAEGGVDEHGNTYIVLRAEDEGGTALALGLGYEFRLSRHFAAGVNVSYNHLQIDGDIFESSTFYPGGLNLNWYF
jgi:opacity protein-like surface antigen